MKILSVFGTRPEAIKMAPLIKLLEQTPGIESKVAVTAQHREMLDQVLHLFAIRPDYDLNLMRHGQTVSTITQAILHDLDPVLEQEQPQLLLVHGDTTTTFAAALAGFYRQIPCGHVEAGLRSGDKYAPYPEELNRKLTGMLADLHFSPTEGAAANLRAENVPGENIFVTGNTVIDALLQVIKKPCPVEQCGLSNVDPARRLIVLTCHRRENWGEPMRQIFAAVAQILREHDDCELVFPVHKNPRVREQAEQAFSLLAAEKRPRVHLIEPLDYLPFAHLLKHSHLVLTDSGGLQEEAPALGKPVLVLRGVTERPEAVAAGTAMLAGTDYDQVYQSTKTLLENDNIYHIMAHATNPYGDGQAAERIRDIIIESCI